MDIIRYTQEKAAEWDRFVGKSKNGTFLFFRQYMDYHSDRFCDFSLMFYDEKARLRAILPANISNNVVYSHQGLTYGGLITSQSTSAVIVVECFKALTDFLKKHRISQFFYKAVPHIYHIQPAEEDLYALFAICDATLTKRDISSAIPLHNRMKFSESRRSGVRKALRKGLSVMESSDIDVFWQILESNLMLQHGVKPVHTAIEMNLLKQRFPDNIRLFVVVKDSRMLGGTLLYITEKVVHTQYISASVEGKRCGALDYLFDYLLSNDTFKCYDYLDFGKSTESDCHNLNKQLIFQKEGFGGRGVCYDTYELAIK